MQSLTGNSAHAVNDVTQEGLLVDLTLSCTSGELKEIHSWLAKPSRAFISEEEHERLRNPEECRKPLMITSSKLHYYMTYANRLAQGSEILFYPDSGLVVKHLTALVRLMRAQLLPNSEFSHARVLRGTYGIRIPVVDSDPAAVCIMWRERDNKRQVYMICCQYKTKLRSI